MARLSYSAPGVYVEEVPSAQQPIAGVGTSTAAFIGKVPDEIIYPVRNDDYNPKAAEIQFRINKLKADTGSDQLQNATKEEINKFEQDKAYLKYVLEEWKKSGKTWGKVLAESKTKPDTKRLQTLQADVETAKTAFETADSAFKKDPTDKTKEERSKKERVWNDLKEELKEASKNVSTAGTEEVGVLKPYDYRKFKVDVISGEAKLCTNFTEYMNYFGPFSLDDPCHRALTHAVYGFFLNGGTRCFVVRITDENQLKTTLETIESIDEVAIVAAPGLTQNQDNWGALVEHCEKLQDRFAILDCAEESVDEAKRPDFSRLTYDRKDVLPKRSNYAAFYFPWIEVVDPAQQLQDQDLTRDKVDDVVDPKYRGRVYVAPSGHIAGIYARTDIERGVFKAPANCAIRGAINVKYYLSQRHQEGLNPQGVNCIRNVNGNVTVWGARTIGGDLNMEWKYINVRRTMLFIRESIDEGTQWVVFEPNDIALWGKIKRNVSAFLTNVWRSGALFGATPEEAFYVKCDAELNPPEVRDLGQVITEIGVAIVRPAEFVIFRISQSTGTKA